MSRGTGEAGHRPPLGEEDPEEDPEEEEPSLQYLLQINVEAAAAAAAAARYKGGLWGTRCIVLRNVSSTTRAHRHPRTHLPQEAVNHRRTSREHRVLCASRLLYTVAMYTVVIEHTVCTGYCLLMTVCHKC